MGQSMRTVHRQPTTRAGNARKQAHASTRNQHPDLHMRWATSALTLGTTGAAAGARARGRAIPSGRQPRSWRLGHGRQAGVVVAAGVVQAVPGAAQRQVSIVRQQAASGVLHGEAPAVDAHAPGIHADAPRLKRVQAAVGHIGAVRQRRVVGWCTAGRRALLHVRRQERRRRPVGRRPKGPCRCGRRPKGPGWCRRRRGCCVLLRRRGCSAGCRCCSCIASAARLLSCRQLCCGSIILHILEQQRVARGVWAARKAAVAGGVVAVHAIEGLVAHDHTACGWAEGVNVMMRQPGKQVREAAHLRNCSSMDAKLATARQDKAQGPPFPLQAPSLESHSSTHHASPG